LSIIYLKKKQGEEDGYIAFTPNCPANIIALDLSAYPEGFYVKQGMYFAQTGGEPQKESVEELEAC